MLFLALGFFESQSSLALLSASLKSQSSLALLSASLKSQSFFLRCSLL